MRTAGGRAWAGKCDVADEKSVAAFFEQGVSRARARRYSGEQRRLCRATRTSRCSDAAVAEVMHVNLDGVYHCVRAVVRGMLLRRWGRIINVSSPSARMPLPGQSAYAASKAGLEGFTRALSRDLAAKGVLVNAVVTRTDRNRHARHDAGGRARGASAAVAVGRIGTAGEVAALVAFLASEASSYITGQVIGVDGASCKIRT